MSLGAQIVRIQRLGDLRHMDVRNNRYDECLVLEGYERLWLVLQ